MTPLLLTALLLVPLAPPASPGAPGTPGAVGTTGPQGLPTPPPELVLEVLGGRATLVQGGEVHTRTRAQDALRLREEAYVELGPGSTLLLRRPGVASFRVEGPAALEWARPKPPMSPMSPRAEERPGKAPRRSRGATPEADPGPPPPPSVLRFLRLRSLEAEVRRGTQVLELPEAWSLRMPRGALHVSQGPSGLTLVHRGGLEIEIHPRAPRDRDLAPTPLRSGGRRFLAPVDDR